MKTPKDHNIAFSWFGMIGVAVFIIAWICAASVDTSWQFGVNTLSEFGVSDTAAKLYFNYGCMLTGIFVAIFGFGHAAYAKNAGHIAGGAFLIIGGVFLTLVGVITKDAENLHVFVALSAALFIFLGIIAIAAGNWAVNRKIIAGVSIVFICLFVTMAFIFDIAEFEACGIILAMIWFLMESVNMIFLSR